MSAFSASRRTSMQHIFAPRVCSVSMTPSLIQGPEESLRNQTSDQPLFLRTRMLVCLSHSDNFWNDNDAIEFNNCQPGAASAPGFVTSLPRYRRLPCLRPLACEALIKGFGCCGIELAMQLRNGVTAGAILLRWSS